MSVYVAVVLVFAIIFVVAMVSSKKPKKEQTTEKEYKYKAKPLMSDNEFEFFNRLVKALPEYYVFPQVSMGAVLYAEKNSKQGTRGTFAQKRIDYIIYKDQSIVAIIELDDKTHVKVNDEKRDSMLHQAGYKTIRFESKNKPSIEEIAKLFK
jgi:peroxiredoxin